MPVAGMSGGGCYRVCGGRVEIGLELGFVIDEGTIFQYDQRADSEESALFDGWNGSVGVAFIGGSD